MTYNILDGGENREQYILQVIQAVNPDAVILQEVFYADVLKELAHVLNMDYFFASGNRKRRVALLSRLPLRSPKSYHPFPPIWRNFVEAEIEYQVNKTFRLIGVHLTASLWVVFELWRWWEAKYIIKHSQNYRDESCLIAGDFNAISPYDRVITDSMPKWLKFVIRAQGNRVYHFSIQEFLSAGFTDCYRFLHTNDDGFTLPPPKPNARLDYIFVNDRMKEHLKECWVVREPPAVIKASDHYPVVAEFEFST